MNRIITIGREFGSGGREIGKRVAEILQIPYYDNEIVTQISERTKLAEDYVNQFSEYKPITYFPITIGRSFQPIANPAEMQRSAICIEQGKILTELAGKSGCVIVGRCADYVLGAFYPMRLFIYADIDFKIKRCREKVPEHGHMSDKEIKQQIQAIDKSRANYYKFVTGLQWSKKTNYDMCINTTLYPIKDLAYTIAQLYERSWGVD